MRRIAIILWVMLATTGVAAARGEPPVIAKELFGGFASPAPAPQPAAIGSYALGCMAGASALPSDGPGWQVMRLSRNRSWGQPELVAFIERLSLEARSDGWPGLLVGDMAQPRGGPMRTGHASHQIGLDADVWLTPMPGRRLTSDERESLGAASMLQEGTREVDTARFGPAQVALIRRAARDPAVARIFVHPGIKQALCAAAGDDRSWLRTVRPWWGHDTHFHVRLACPNGQALCRNQEPPPPGDGCGSELAWWLSDEPWRAKPPGKPAKPVMLADLPARCATLVQPK